MKNTELHLLINQPQLAADFLYQACQAQGLSLSKAHIKQVMQKLTLHDLLDQNGGFAQSDSVMSSIQ